MVKVYGRSYLGGSKIGAFPKLSFNFSKAYSLWLDHLSLESPFSKSVKGAAIFA